MKTILLFFFLGICRLCIGQTEFRLGLKLHPNFTFTSSKSETNTTSSIQSTAVVPMTGLNFGLAANTLFNDNFLLEISSSVASNNIGRRFVLGNINEERKESKISYKTLSWMNEIKMSCKVFSKPKPYYDVFVGINGHANVSQINSYNSSSSSEIIIAENTADIFYSGEKFNTFGLGVHTKIRTEIKRFGHFDYGLSYAYGITPFPEFSVTSKGNIFCFQPQVHLFQLNFIYYFKTWK